jgi:hypothetical protein
MKLKHSTFNIFTLLPARGQVATEDEAVIAYCLVAPIECLRSGDG